MGVYRTCQDLDLNPKWKQLQREAWYQNFLVKNVIIEILKWITDRPVIILLEEVSDVGHGSGKDKIKFYNFQ